MDVLIIAGPGTGKTRTLTHKIVYLLEEKGVDVQEILALTFTKKAAAEMKDRLKAMVSGSKALAREQNSAKQALRSRKRPPFIGTFHSLAFGILQDKGIEPRIATDKQLAEILRKICGNSFSKKVSLKSRGALNKKDLSRKISMFKISDGRYFAEAKDLVDKYNTELEKRELMDYDDLLLKALMVAKKEDVKYSYILVDEFQDTNNIQYRLIKQLLDNKGQLLVIGDPKQSIYAFRGSNEEIFQKFKKDFAHAEKIVLERNYRSGTNIISSSSALFKDAIKLKADKKEKGAVKLVETYDQYSEADWILKEINEKVGGIDLNFAADVDLEKQSFSFADFAVVYRTHNLNRILEKKFYQFGIPFQVIGGRSLFEQKEIKFIITALYYLASPTSMNRFIEVENPEESLVQLRGLGVVDDPVPIIKTKLDKLSVDNKVSSLVKEVVDSFSLEEGLEGKNIALQNLKALAGSAVKYDKKAGGLEDFLNRIKYLEEHEYYDERADMVTLMTMHAAKGLEFPFVYIIGFEEGIIPHKKSIQENKLDEEKRLLYVAMTRAEEELQLLHTQKRHGKTAAVSRFAKNIQDKNVEKIEDEQIKLIKNRIEKSKKRQLGLF